MWALSELSLCVMHLVRQPAVTFPRGRPVLRGLLIPIFPFSIPQVPGSPLNQKPGQPGAWAYDSQATYILPNPRYTKGSKVAPFVYMGDRWDFSNQ